MKKHWIALMLSAWASLALAANAPSNMALVKSAFINRAESNVVLVRFAPCKFADSKLAAKKLTPLKLELLKLL